MKIVHVEAGRHLYGGARQVLYLLEGLRRRDCTSLLVCPPHSAIAVEARALGIDVREIPLGGDLDVGFIGRLRAVLRQERPDIVHLHSRRGADILGGAAARLERVRCVLSRRVDNPEPAAWVRIKYALYDRVIVISEGIRRVLLAEGVSPEKVTCVHSAVAVSPVPACDRDWFSRELRLQPGATALGVIAQLIPRKGHRHLLAALAGVLPDYPQLHVLCFGQGPLEGELAAALGSPPYAGRVHLCGFRDDLPSILPCLYGVVHPAEMEGLGVSLLQAAAANLPIVASAVGGIPEVVHEGINGWLVPPADPAALAQAIRALLDDPRRAASRGQAGSAMVRDRFSVEAMVEGNWRVYQAVLKLKQTQEVRP